MRGTREERKGARAWCAGELRRRYKPRRGLNLHPSGLHNISTYRVKTRQPAQKSRTSGVGCIWLYDWCFMLTFPLFIWKLVFFPSVSSHNVRGNIYMYYKVQQGMSTIKTVEWQTNYSGFTRTKWLEDHLPFIRVRVVDRKEIRNSKMYKQSNIWCWW